MSDSQVVKDKYLGLSALFPFSRESSSPRNCMASGMFAQVVTLNNPDRRITQSGADVDLLDNTFCIETLSDCVVVGVVKRGRDGVSRNLSDLSDMTIITRDILTGELDILVVPRYHKLSQKYGFKYVWNEELLRRISIGTKLDAGVRLAVSPSIKNKETYSYGLEAKVCYYTIRGVCADGIVISESLAKRLSYTHYEYKCITGGVRDIPLNIYGDESEYKIMPDIGERVGSDSVIMARRNFNSDNALATMSARALRTYDDKFDTLTCSDKPNGVVVDIVAYVNVKKNRLPLSGTLDSLSAKNLLMVNHHKQILHIYEQQRVEYMERNGDDIKVSARFHNVITDCMAITDGVNPINLSHNKDKLDLYRVEIVIEHLVNMVELGDKLATEYGNKGVICDIVPDHLMVGGADMILCPTSIPGRMNVSNLYAQYFGALSRDVKRHVTSIVTNVDTMSLEERDEAFEYVLGMLKIIATEQYSYYNEASESEIVEILRDIIGEEMYIFYKNESVKRPYSILGDFIGTKYEIPKKHVICHNPVNGEFMPRLTKKKIFTGTQYVMLLAKSPDEFLSCASAKLNYFGLPVGGLKGDLPWRNTPVKVLSETETRIVIAIAGEEAYAELKDRGNSPESHKEVYRNILTADKPSDVDNLLDRDKFPLGQDVGLKIINSVLNPMGKKFKYVK